MGFHLMPQLESFSDDNIKYSKIIIVYKYIFLLNRKISSYSELHVYYELYYFFWFIFRTNNLYAGPLLSK